MPKTDQNARHHSSVLFSIGLQFFQKFNHWPFWEPVQASSSTPLSPWFGRIFHVIWHQRCSRHWMYLQRWQLNPATVFLLSYKVHVISKNHYSHHGNPIAGASLLSSPSTILSWKLFARTLYYVEAKCIWIIINIALSSVAPQPAHILLWLLSVSCPWPLHQSSLFPSLLPHSCTE